MSPFQTAQMYSLTDPNIFNIAIDGCQGRNRDAGRRRGIQRDMRIGTVNSINWARVAAPDRSYFKAICGDQEG
jgi:threonine synthase